MKILITGGLGYIGSVLQKYLSESRGYHQPIHVVTIDNLMYGQGPLVYNQIRSHNIIDNVLDWKKSLLDEIHTSDVIVPLHALVGAPLCDKFPDLATETNHLWYKKFLKHLSPRQLVIYPNTNSGYGSVKDGMCTEETPTNPISLYAKDKEQTEKLLLENHENTIVFRLATVFGLSPRPRLDLLVNNLTVEAHTKNRIEVFDPDFQRNYVHVQDIARAFYFAILNQRQMVGQVYNLGNDTINMSKIELAKRIASIYECLTQQYVDITENRSKTDGDKRNYLVSSKKLYDLGFSCNKTLYHGVQELINYLPYIDVNDSRMKNYDNFAHSI